MEKERKKKCYYPISFTKDELFCLQFILTKEKAELDRKQIIDERNYKMVEAMLKKLETRIKDEGKYLV